MEGTLRRGGAAGHAHRARECSDHSARQLRSDKRWERRNLPPIQELSRVRLPVSFSYSCISGVTAAQTAAPPPTGDHRPGTQAVRLMGASTWTLLWLRRWAGLPRTAASAPQLPAASGRPCHPVPQHLPRAVHASLPGHHSTWGPPATSLPALLCRCQVHCPDKVSSGLCSVGPGSRLGSDTREAAGGAASGPPLVK